MLCIFLVYTLVHTCTHLHTLYTHALVHTLTHNHYTHAHTHKHTRLISGGEASCQWSLECWGDGQAECTPQGSPKLSLPPSLLLLSGRHRRCSQASHRHGNLHNGRGLTHALPSPPSLPLPLPLPPPLLFSFIPSSLSQGSKLVLPHTLRHLQQRLQGMSLTQQRHSTVREWSCNSDPLISTVLYCMCCIQFQPSCLFSSLHTCVIVNELRLLDHNYAHRSHTSLAHVCVCLHVCNDNISDIILNSHSL